MGIRDAIIILILSQTLCDARGRGLASSLLQGLLSSNPQLLKMVSNRLASPYQPCYEVGPSVQSQIPNVPAFVQSQIQNGPAYVQSQFQKGPAFVQSQFQNGPAYVQSQIQSVPAVQSQFQYSPAQYQVQNVVKDVPVVKETQTIQQTQYPVQYSTVQQTETSYPACSKPCPFCSPISMVNPFLPAASPVSALCPPTSNLLPPANPSMARSQFLRKIPIPPPCL